MHVGNQRIRGVVIARLWSSVRSLLHQRWDLHQLAYLYLSKDREPTSHHKTPGNLCTRMWWKHFPTAEKWSQQNYEVSGWRMGSIGLMIRKLRSKQSSNVAAKNVQRTCPALDRIYLVSPDISGKSTGYVQSTQKLSSQLWFLSYEAPNWMKPGHKGLLQTWNTFPKEVFPKSKDFPFDVGLTQKD
jgi:hypothetical protein